MENDKIINGNCWVAYCDILGFKNRVKEFERQAGVGYLDVFVKNYFDRVIEELKRQKAYWPNDVFITWFSDTFLFFTRNDSIDAFGCVKAVCDVFCWFVISGKWPLRAAIGFGQLYADISKGTFLGSGIINAYEYAEKQNWIGAVVTPEANNRLFELGVDLHRWRSSFTKYSVPFRRRQEGEKASESLFVFKTHYNRPEVRRAVEIMQKEMMADKNCLGIDNIKYENTLKFYEEAE